MFSKFVKSIVLSLIFLLILAYAALVPMDKTAMRRESDRPVIQGEIVLSLDQALNLSLAYGDYRRVDFAPFGLSWEA